MSSSCSPRNSIQYFGNQSANTSAASDFQNFTLSYWLHNRGPSPIHNASFKILLPLRQLERYYLYPYNSIVSITVHLRLTISISFCTQIDPPDMIDCAQEGIIDPENVQGTGFVPNLLQTPKRSITDVVNM